MNKFTKISVSIVALLGVTAAGTSVFYSSYVKKEGEKYAKLAVETLYSGSMVAEKTSVSATPISFEARYTNPTISVDKAILTNDISEILGSNAPKLPVGSMISNTKYQGDIVFSYNMLTDKVVLTFPKEAETVSKEGDKEIVMLSQSDSDSFMSAKFDRPLIKRFHPFEPLENMDNFKKYTKEVEVDSPKFTVLDKESNNKLLSADNLDFDIKINRKDGKLNLVSGKVDILNFEITEHLFANIEESLPKTTIADLVGGGPLTFKGDLEIKANDLDAVSMEGNDVIIALSNLLIENNHAALKGNLALDLTGAKKDEPNGTIKGDMTYVVKEAFYDYIMKVLSDPDAVMQILVGFYNEDANFNMLDSAQKREVIINSVNAWTQNLNVLFPKDQMVGEVKFETDINVATDSSKTSNLKINKLGFTGGGFSFNIKGDANIPGEQIWAAKYNVVIELNGYKSMLNGLFDYLNKAYPVIAVIMNVQEPIDPAVFPEINQSIQHVLLAISDKPSESSENLSITIKNSDNNPLPTIGTLPLPQAMETLGGLGQLAEKVIAVGAGDDAGGEQIQNQEMMPEQQPVVGE